MHRRPPRYLARGENDRDLSTSASERPARLRSRGTPHELQVRGRRAVRHRRRRQPACEGARDRARRTAFRRSARAIALTPEGRKYLPSIRTAFEVIARATEATAPGLRGRKLRLGIARGL